MKFISKTVSQISIGGVLLKAERQAQGFVLEVEEGFKHVKELATHGFEVLEEEAGALVRRRGAGGGTGEQKPTEQQPSAPSPSGENGSDQQSS